MPILLLTGRDSSHDKAIGLDAGADDYVVKPFDEEELVARIRALLRRGGSTSLPVLEWGSLKLDPTTHEATYDEQPLQLTPKEYALLELLLRNNRRVFSCGVILEHLWSYEETPGEEAVRTHIKGLRQKLKVAGAPADLIETVYGIGYRLKPLEPNTVPSATTEIREPTQQQTVALLAKVWHRYKERVSEQVGILEQASDALLQQTLDEKLQQQAAKEAHTLAGALGTFGLPEGSRLARKIERILQKHETLGQAEAKLLSKLVKSLRQEIEGNSDNSAIAPETEDERPLLLIVDSDRAWGDQLVAETAHWGLRAKIALNLASAREKISRDHPKIVLLDLSSSKNTENRLTLLSELGKLTPPIPVVVLTTQDHLSQSSNGSTLRERLEVARLGGRAFLQKPASPSQVLEIVTQVLHRSDNDVAKVMVVDDDPKILAALRTLLAPWGLKLTTLEDPQRFWETLEACSPDLLILDVEMPHLSGIELCQIVRNDPRWSGLPILFLTVHTDAAIVNQVFAAGADDFINKPIVGPELVTRIINRLERVKLLRTMAETDPLTRVSNRHKSTQDLEKFFSLAKRYGQPLCLGILDLDRFKHVNDTFGHATGDSVLRHLGQLLLRSFRNEDVVARWGGEEFVVGMYGMTKNEGVKRLLKVLETLYQHEFLASESLAPFRITFSAGVAQYPQDGADLRSLYQAADAALIRAKKARRDLPSGTLDQRIVEA